VFYPTRAPPVSNRTERQDDEGIPSDKGDKGRIFLPSIKRQTEPNDRKGKKRAPSSSSESESDRASESESEDEGSRSKRPQRKRRSLDKDESRSGSPRHRRKSSEQPTRGRREVSKEQQSKDEGAGKPKHPSPTEVAREIIPRLYNEAEKAEKKIVEITNKIKGLKELLLRFKNFNARFQNAK
jgi:hypothetical protein